jgi:hypothetical protein
MKDRTVICALVLLGAMAWVAAGEEHEVWEEVHWQLHLIAGAIGLIAAAIVIAGSKGIGGKLSGLFKAMRIGLVLIAVHCIGYGALEHPAFPEEMEYQLELAFEGIIILGVLALALGAKRLAELAK